MAAHSPTGQPLPAGEIATRGRARDGAAVLRAVADAARERSIEEALAGALDRLLDAFGLDGARAYLLDGESQALVLAAARGHGEAGEAAVALGECLCGIAAQTGELLQARDPARDPRVTRESCRRLGARACAAVPLPAGERVLGVLHLVSAGDAFSGEEIALLR